MPSRGTSCRIRYFAYDTTNKQGKTGDVGNHTIKIQKDFSISTVPTNPPVEVNSPSLPGWYAVDLTSDETDCDTLLVAGKSSTAGVVVQGTQVTFEDLLWARLISSPEFAVGGTIGQAILSNLTNIIVNTSDTLTAIGALPQLDAIITAIQAMEIETGFSFLNIMKYIGAFVAGLTNGGGTDELIFRDLNNTLDRIKFTLSSHNNRIAVERDNT